MALAHPCPFNQCLHMYDVMWGGDQTPPASHGLQLLPGLQGYPVFYRLDPWQGHWAGQGNTGEDKEYSVLFFKEKYSLFQAYGNFQSVAVLHLCICLSKVPGC